MKIQAGLAAAGLAAALAMTPPAPAGAAAAEGSFAVRGFGAESCANANQRIEQDPASAANALAWLLGYMTAINRAQADTFDASPVVDGGAMLQLVVGLCAENPEALVESVVFDLLRTLAVARVRESSPIVETRANDARAEVRRETLTAIQTRLIELGHLAGEADGVYGPQTRRALRAFQREQDIPDTGIADSITIVRLLVELPQTQDGSRLPRHGVLRAGAGSR